MILGNLGYGIQTENMRRARGASTGSSTESTSTSCGLILDTGLTQRAIILSPHRMLGTLRLRPALRIPTLYPIRSPLRIILDGPFR